MSLLKHAVRDIGALRGQKQPAQEYGEDEQQLRQALSGLRWAPLWLLGPACLGGGALTGVCCKMGRGGVMHLQGSAA